MHSRKQGLTIGADGDIFCPCGQQGLLSDLLRSIIDDRNAALPVLNSHGNTVAGHEFVSAGDACDQAPRPSGQASRDISYS